MPDSLLTTARDQVLAAMRDLKRHCTQPVVVALDGPSGSGKSTLAALIAETIDAIVIPVDDFFRADISDQGWDARSAEEKIRDVFDWPRLRSEAIEPLLAGNAARWHAFDFEAGLRPDGTFGMRGDWILREPAPVILLDGAYTAGPQLADLVDLSVLVDAPADERRARLAAREEQGTLEAWHARWDAAEEHYFTRVRPRGSYDVEVSARGGYWSPV